jgi:multiple sugar transport system ATP-binding protein
MATRIRLRDVEKSFGATPVLAGIDLAVEAGEFCVFVGPSGCGKSTLLRLIAGLEDVSRGEIEIDGRIVTALPPSERDVAMVFQSYALYPHMTAFDNMAFGLGHRMPSGEVERRVRDAARLLQLDALLQRLPRELSGGQRQRVAIGRAIVRQPKVFLFDEPLSNLDASLRATTRVELSRLHRELGSASMVYVTHDQVEAMTLADRIVLLRPVAERGSQPSIAQIGAPLDLYHRPADRFVAGFIGSPAMNFLPAAVAAIRPDGVEALVDGRSCVAPVRGDGLAIGAPITLGIRPEHVRLGDGGISARVTHVERLGEHSVLYLRLPGTSRATVLAKSARDDVAPGETVPIFLPAHSLHLFDAQGRAQPRLATR